MPSGLTGRGAHRRARRRRRQGLGLSLPTRLLRIALLVPVIAMCSFVPIRWPDTDPPAPADAVFVLSGDHGERLPIAMSLVERGLVSTLVFVGTADRGTEAELCSSRQRVEYICLRPQPDNTKTEAQAAARLAEARGWRDVVVVTSRYHATRARILFRRCFGGRIRIMGGDPPYSREMLERQMSTEWRKVIYTVAVDRSC